MADAVAPGGGPTAKRRNLQRKELGRGLLLLGDLGLQARGGGRQVGTGGLEQERIDTAITVDCAQRRHADAQRHMLPQCIARQRNGLQIRAVDPFGLVVGVADIVANHWALTGQFATARHGETL